MMEQPFLRQESAATSHAAWSPRSPAYEASRLRFYVLFVLSFFSCMQCACWFAFSSVDPALVKAYMGAAVPNDATIALLLNWGPVVGVAAAPAQLRLGADARGLERSVRAGAWLVFLGSALRCAPCLVARAGRGAWWCVGCVHGGQILNAAAGPLCMGTVSRLSVVWFPERERLFATAVGSMANGLGVVLMYPLAPAIVARPRQFELLLLVLLACSAVPAVLAAAKFPAAPDAAPSAAAEAARARVDGELAGRKAARRAPAPSALASYAATVAAAGMVAGSATAWQGVFQTVLKGPLGEKRIGLLRRPAAATIFERF
jgi:hypothetical protein